MGTQHVENVGILTELIRKERTMASNKSRCLCVDRASMVTGWDVVSDHHRFLLNEAPKTFPEVSFGHILVPGSVADQPQVSVITEHNLHRLLTLFNTVGWLTLCRWFWDMSKGFVDGFRPTASEEYTLQAIFEDYRHQVFSMLQQQEMRELVEAIEESAKASERGEIRRAMDAEKVAMAKRGKLEAMLIEQRQLLGQIEEGIRTIEDRHGELNVLRQKARKMVELYDMPISVVGVGNEEVFIKFQSLASGLKSFVVTF